MSANQETTLLERESAGLHVEVRYLPITRTLVLQTWTEAAQAAVSLPPDRVIDAFEHPLVYLNDAQAERLFPRGS